MKTTSALTVELAFALVSAPVAHAGSLPMVPAQFHEITTMNAATVASSDQWWTIFNDPVLDDLIARAHRGNSSLQEAAARVSQARAKVRGANAARLPELGVNAGVSQQTGPLINAAGGSGTLFTAGASLSWEVDLLGRLSKAAKAARLEVQEREALLANVRLLSEADIAQTYFEIRALVAERLTLVATAERAAQALEIVASRQRNGIASDLDVARARGRRDAIALDAAALDQSRAEAEHRVAFLIGDAVLDLALPNDEIGAPPQIPANIPSVVLRRRADVAAAEHKVASERLRLKIARDSWFPRIGLTASGGLVSSALVDLLKSSAQSFGASLLLSLPIFDGGRRKAGIAGATADLELASAEYQTRVLTAFRDVEDQLSAVRTATARAGLAEAAAAADHAAAQILAGRVERGTASKLDLLDAEHTALAGHCAAIRTSFARYAATIGLIKAFGGGWATHDPQ